MMHNFAILAEFLIVLLAVGALTAVFVSRMVTKWEREDEE